MIIPKHCGECGFRLSLWDCVIDLRYLKIVAKCPKCKAKSYYGELA